MIYLFYAFLAYCILYALWIRKKVVATRLEPGEQFFGKASYLDAYLIIRGAEILVITFIINAVIQYLYPTYHIERYSLDDPRYGTFDNNPTDKHLYDVIGIILALVTVAVYLFWLRPQVRKGFKKKKSHLSKVLLNDTTLSGQAAYQLAKVLVTKIPTLVRYHVGFVRGSIFLFILLLLFGSVIPFQAREFNSPYMGEGIGETFTKPLGLSFMWPFLTWGYLSFIRLFAEAFHDAGGLVEDAWEKLGKEQDANAKEAAIRAHYGEQKGWALPDEYARLISETEPGLYVGQGMYWNKKGHLLTVGSSRAGKGTNLIIPNLLSPNFAASGASFICLDPKGENAAITSGPARRSGFEVHILNPFGIGDLPSSRFNPFSLTSKDSKDVIEFCDTMAEMVVPYSAKADATSEHFDAQARSILSAYMLHMLDTLPPDEINFGTLFRWANYSGGQLTTLLSAMAVSTSHRGVVGSIISGFFENMTGGGEKETSGILSTIRKGLSPFKNPQLQEATEASDFDLSVLTEKQAGIYICLQQYQMEANAVWMRVIIGAALKYMQRHYSKERRVLFLLDEFPTLGYMKDIEQNMGFIAGYNVSFWIIVQSLVQLQKLYPNSWEVFTANALVQHFLGIGDLTTAKYVSERLPEVVSILRHEAEVREIKKRLLSPDEVINFPGIILLLAGCSSPIQFQKMPYYTTEPYRSAADPNPFI